MPMQRRRFVQTAAWLAIAGRAARAEPSAGRTPIIDTHLHCFAGKDDRRFPYHPRGPYQPAAPATPERLLKCMRDAGVDAAIVVHPEPYQDDHRYLEYCLDVGKGKLKGTCLFFAGRPGALEAMTGLVKRRAGQIVAVRIHAYAPDRLPPLGTPELRAFWKQAGDLGLAIQLHLEPRHAPGFDSLIREFDRTTVIIDHLGRPMQATPQEYAVVLGWSRLPNTVMKLSSLPAKEQYPHRDVGPIIQDLVDRFGPDRLIYGGGFGPDADGASYRAYREKVRSYLSDLSAEAQAKVLGGTAARLFGFTGA
jgi:predicted TIM-barrel fold metal-dependent hydrolase